MNQSKFVTALKARAAKLPRKVWIASGVVLLLAVLYGVVFFREKPVTFSYQQEVCVGHFLLAPEMQKTATSDFVATPKDVTRIGPVALFSTRLCFEPQTSPDEGRATITVSPFGGPVFAKRFAVEVPKAPAVRAADFINTTIATARPLKIPLSIPDTLHSYSLKVGDKTAECPQKDTRLDCQVDSLDLDQGAEYPVALQKQFKDEGPVLLASGTIATHVPLQKTEASITENQVLYDTPKTFTITFEKELETTKATLEKLNGEDAEPLDVTVTQEGAVATIAATEDLPRQSKFRLTLAEAVAKDGSSTQDPLVTHFETSGGPKVKSVSIGAGSVAPGTQVVVTFDQPLKEDVDVAKLMRTTEVPSAVRKLSPMQVAFKLQGGSDCAAFAIVIDKGVKSGSNNEASSEPWTHTSRITCGTSWVIGYSVRGRPIVAHSFGSGSTILFTGGIHGNEGSTVTTMNAWVQHLQAHAGSLIPAGKRVVIVPNTNPDGIATGSRNNVNNVNLGRNFATANWKADIETANGVLVNGGGTSPTSEPEAAALAALTRQLRPRLEVSFHSQGRLVGANKYGDSVAIGDMYAKTVGYRTMFYNAEAVMGYPMTGEYEDWMGESLGIPAILIELPSHSGNYLSSQLPALKKLLAL